MPLPQTTVALSKEASEAISKAMKRRGETDDTYFSGKSGGRFVREAAVAQARELGLDPTFNPSESVSDSAGAKTVSDGVAVVKPASMKQYRSAIVSAGLSQADQDFELSLNLFSTPESRAKSRSKASAVAWQKEAPARSLAREKRASSFFEFDFGAYEKPARVHKPRPELPSTGVRAFAMSDGTNMRGRM